MPAPATNAEFLDLIRKSGLVGPERLESYLGMLQSVAPLPDEPKQLVAVLVRDGLLTHFQSQQLLAGKWRGFTIGKYKVLERLGAGGMGTVYLCEHTVMRRRVALKVLPIDRAGDPSSLGRFHREAQAAAALDHPNIVRAHDVCHEGNLHFLVMEYVDGVSLQELVQKNGPLDVARACHYVAQAADGLQHAHEAGLVHRDIKPGNLIVNRQGTVKVLDMGLALFFHDKTNTLTNQYDDKAVLGTADYLAPEQALSSHDVDIRADVYGLGATFYFLLTGRPPFGEGTVAQKLVWHQLREVDSVQGLRPDVPDELDRVIRRMLAKQPADRYQEPAEVAEALAPWTQTPIPPPAEEDLHRLSPAAMGPAAPPDGRSTVPGSGLTGRTGRPSQAPARSGVTPRPGAAPPKSAVAKPGPASKERITSRPAAQEKPDDRGGELTVPPRRAVTAPLGKRLLIVWGSAAAAGVLLMGLVLGAVWLLAGKRSPSAEAEKPEPEELPRFVLHRQGKDYAVTSLQEALDKAQPGDRVVVQTDVLAEAVRLRDGTAKQVTLEGRSRLGGAVRWQPPADLPRGQALLDVTGVPGLSVQGFHFDGKGRVNELVTVSGHCPGLVLEDVRLEGFARSAVGLRGCAGSDGQPVALRRLRTFAPAAGAEAGLVLAAAPNRPNQHVAVSDCRFEGPCQALVELAGDAADVEFRRNRFFKARDGLVCKKAAPFPRLQFHLAHNTFCDLERGLHWEARPTADNPSRVRAEYNLFLKTPHLGFVDGLTLEPQGCTAEWIWFDERQAKPPAEFRYFRKTFTFTKTPDTRALLEIGCDDQFKVWLNDKRIDQKPHQYFTKRVYAFDVSQHLVSGENVLAVEGGNLNDFVTNKPTDAGLLVQLTATAADQKSSVVLVSDASWKASRTGPNGWQGLAFDDGAWQDVKAFGTYGKKGLPWGRLVWDSAVSRQFRGTVPIALTLAGNVRDFGSGEGFPFLEARGGSVTVPDDPSNDAKFLRYPKTSPLTKVGSPGVPPVD